MLAAGLPLPARGAFSARAGGVSRPPYDSLNLGSHVGDDADAVAANREHVRRTAGVSALVFAEQVHGSAVAEVDRSPDGGVPGTDALVTTTPGLGLVVMAADCLPVLLADAEAGVVAAAHAGRAGLAAGVLQQTLAVMARRGAEAARTVAVIGPAACGRCYEVPAAMADEVEQAVPGSRATTRAGTPSVDLAAGASAVLRAAGLARVESVGGCTIEQPHRWFSYRRDGRTGRHAGVVWLAGGGAGGRAGAARPAGCRARRARAAAGSGLRRGGAPPRVGHPRGGHQDPSRLRRRGAARAGGARLR